MLTSTIAEAWFGAASPAGRERVFTAVGHWYRLRRDTRRLLTFNDHLLRDIGLGRGEIEQAVRSGRASRSSAAS